VAKQGMDRAIFTDARKNSTQHKIKNSKKRRRIIVKRIIHPSLARYYT